MIPLRKHFRFFLLTLLLLVSASTAYGHPRPPNGHDIVRETVSGSLPAGQCSMLPAELEITLEGERHMVVNTQTLQDGSTRTITNDQIRGEAWDNQGGQYRFVYVNHSVMTVVGTTAFWEMTDSFELHGRGGAPSYSVGFNIRWSEDVNNPPGVWPPPGVEVVSMHGDAFACDPL